MLEELRRVNPIGGPSLSVMLTGKTFQGFKKPSIDTSRNRPLSDQARNVLLEVLQEV